LIEASIAAHRFSEVLKEQYNKEIRGWERKEIAGKVVKRMLDYGASLIVWPPVLLSNIPTDWRLLLIYVIEVLKRKLYARVGALDVKEIVEALYDVKNWPFVEKGIPYLLWRTHRQK